MRPGRAIGNVLARSVRGAVADVADLESSDGVRQWGTVGVSENIIEASWQALVDSVAVVAKKRRPTKPTCGSVAKRLEYKRRHAQVKAGRRSQGIE